MFGRQKLTRFRPVGGKTRVRMVAPSYAIDAAHTAQVTSILGAEGLTVEPSKSKLERFGKISANDVARAEELHQAFLDPSVGAVLVAQGGYGCTRLLSSLDRDLIAEHAKPLIGFSDATALLVALVCMLNSNAVHGPTARSLANHMCPLSISSLAATLRGDWTSYGVALEKVRSRLRVLRAGRTVAPLIGGNLSLLASLLGTPFDFDTNGKILMLEDWNEPQYRLDRMLTQLKLAGKLEQVAGVIIGELVGISREGEDIAETIEERLLSLLPPEIPVIANFPCGHGVTNLPLLLGAIYSLDGDALGLIAP